jgi:hypothetical protein
MTGHGGDDGGCAVALAFLRATLLAVIFVSAQLVDARSLADSQFFLVFWLAVGYALAGIVVALRSSTFGGARTGVGIATEQK